jgi:hypothetical protein
MNNLEQLADLLVDAIVNLDPQEFEAIAGAVGRFKSEGSPRGCPEFATLFGAIERAVMVADPPLPATGFRPPEAELPSVRKADPADAGMHLREVTGRPERRNIQNQGRRRSDVLRTATG